MYVGGLLAPHVGKCIIASCETRNSAKSLSDAVNFKFARCDQLDASVCGRAIGSTLFLFSFRSEL